MTRRTALTSAALSMAPRHPHKPPRLKPGDTIGIVSPASAVPDEGKWENLKRIFERLQLKPKFGRSARGKRKYLAGTTEDRLADLHALWADPEVNAVFSTRGGYGSGQLLDKIDYKLIDRHPKVFLGYSDITAMHLAIYQRTGLITFHGPGATAPFPPYTEEWFRRTLFNAEPLGALRNPEDTPVRVVRPGKARGRLIGGNLSLVSALMGTPFEIETKDRILFLEDVGEVPYRIDRMLTQLRLAGKLRESAGIVIGECVDCEDKRRPEESFRLAEVIDMIVGEAGVPALANLKIGHTDEQLTLPVGAMASIENGVLTVEEAAVS